MEMFTCDYRDLIEPKQKSQADAQKFLGHVQLDGVDINRKQSFTEIAYPSGPEPKIPV